MSKALAASVVEATDSACALCSADPITAGGTGPDARWSVVYADDILVALVVPDVAGVLIAPRPHIGGLATSPELAGVLLGALRKTAIAVKTSYRTSGVTVQPITDVPGAPGHVCYHVVPTMPTSEPPSATAHPERLVPTLTGKLSSASAVPRGWRSSTFHERSGSG